MIQVQSHWLCPYSISPCVMGHFVEIFSPGKDIANQDVTVKLEDHLLIISKLMMMELVIKVMLDRMSSYWQSCQKTLPNIV